MREPCHKDHARVQPTVIHTTPGIPAQPVVAHGPISLEPGFGPKIYRWAKAPTATASSAQHKYVQVQRTGADEDGNWKLVLISRLARGRGLVRPSDIVLVPLISGHVLSQAREPYKCFKLIRTASREVNRQRMILSCFRVRSARNPRRPARE